MSSRGLDATGSVESINTQQCQIPAKPIFTANISDCCSCVCHATVNDFYSDTHNKIKWSQIISYMSTIPIYTIYKHSTAATG